MKVYHYHEDGSYAGCSDADTLPGRRHLPDSDLSKYLIPANCTLVEPPVTKDGEIAYWKNTKWRICTDYSSMPVWVKETGEKIDIGYVYYDKDGVRIFPPAITDPLDDRLTTIEPPAIDSTQALKWEKTKWAVYPDYKKIAVYRKYDNSIVNLGEEVWEDGFKVHPPELGQPLHDSLSLTPVEPSREYKESLINTERNRRMNLNFMFEGVEYQSSGRIADALGALVNDDDTIQWIAANNDFITMDKATFQRFYKTWVDIRTNMILKARFIKNLKHLPEDYTDDKYWIADDR
jgi:hypothetical protein